MSYIRDGMGRTGFTVHGIGMPLVGILHPVPIITLGKSEHTGHCLQMVQKIQPWRKGSWTNYIHFMQQTRERDTALRCIKDLSFIKREIISLFSVLALET